MEKQIETLRQTLIALQKSNEILDKESIS